MLGGSGIPNADGWCACRCPAHDDHRASLSLKDSSRGLALKCFAGCTSAAVKQAIAAALKSGVTLPPPVAPELRESGSIDLLAIAARRWHEGVPLPGTLTKQYLRGRGIESEPKTVRSHPRLFHKEAGTYGPAMIALVQDAVGEAVGLHRTWLNPLTAGKAKFDPVRKVLCSVRGHAVHLIDAAGDIIAVSEGIENGLSYAQLRSMTGATQVPVWAALSASGIANLIVPDRFVEVVVIGDRDQACIDAVNKLTARLARQKVSMQFPEIGRDFNDALLAARS
jgi:hypothetical protein